MNQISLPYQNLVAFQVAKQLVQAVVAADIKDAELKDQATRAVKSAALNTAEGAGRQSPRDKARVFAIARGEAAEAAAAVEIAAALGATGQQAELAVRAIAARLCAMLYALSK